MSHYDLARVDQIRSHFTRTPVQLNWPSRQASFAKRSKLMEWTGLLNFLSFACLYLSTTLTVKKSDFT
eukprot:s5_g58.t1